MSVHALYFPILRAKAGELDALAHLSERARLRIIPLLDIPEPREEGHVPTKEYLASVCEQLARTWGTARPLYLDISRYPAGDGPDSASALIDHLFMCARQARLQALPVAGPVWFRGGEYLKAVANVASGDGRGLALRLPLDDFVDEAKLRETLGSCLDALGLRPGRVDLILDFEALARLPAPKTAELAIVNVTAPAIQLAGSIGFRRIVLCGSSVPEGSNAGKPPPRLEIERRELAAWQRITGDRPGLAVGFGDYAVISPFQAMSTKRVRVPARVRIPTPQKQVFMRAPRRDYRTLSKAAVADDSFGLVPSCWGSFAVRDCAANYGSVGGPTQWVARDTNMHIESTVVHVERHLERVAPELLGAPFQLPHVPWLQESLLIPGEGR